MQSSGRNAQLCISCDSGKWDHSSHFDNSLPTGHNSSPYFFKRIIAFVVHAARNLMQEQVFCHKVSLTNFSRPNCWPDGLDCFQGVRPWVGTQACNQCLV